MVNDPAVKQVVVEQTKQWSEMMERHRKENWELMRDHLKAQEDVLRKAMQTQQQMQIKELENFFEKYSTLLNFQTLTLFSNPYFILLTVNSIAFFPKAFLTFSTTQISRFNR